MYDFTTGKPPASRLFYQLGERLHSEHLLILRVGRRWRRAAAVAGSQAYTEPQRFRFNGLSIARHWWQCRRGGTSHQGRPPARGALKCAPDPQGWMRAIL
jgi:hypothetical protein